MEYLNSQYLIGFLIISILVVVFLLIRRNSISELYRSSIPAIWSLEFFLKNRNRQKNCDKYYIFSEQTVRSNHFRINGRFDQAIFHMSEKPVLDAIIERKFPVHILPRNARKEDIFQAGLYALAIMDQGVAIKSSKLVVIYCLQKRALKCVRKSRGIDCLKCRHSRVFVQKFKSSEIIKKLRKLDEIWENHRKPKASPSVMKCKVCPFGKTICKHSKA